MRFGWLVLAAAATPAAAQRVKAPATVVGGGPVPVRVTGLPPGAQATLVAERVVGRGERYRSETAFRADGRGVVDLARAAPVGGGYRGVDPAGPFWSMRPDPKTAAGVEPGTARLTVLVDGKAVATRVTRFERGDARVVSEEVAAFPGATLFRLPGGAKRPVVIMLGGSEGGDGYGRAFGPVLASRGYAALSLPYYSPDWGGPRIAGLPVDFAGIPVDRLALVRDWIAGRPELDAARIGLVGVSKGGEFAMLAASRFPWLKAVAGIVPSDVVWVGWGPSVTADDTRASFAWAGKPLPFVPYQGMRETIAALYRGERRTLRTPHEAGRAAHPDRAAAAVIPVERYRGAMLVAGGGRDATWASADMVRSIAARRARAGLRTEALIFPDAGHGLSGDGWEPTAYPGEADPAATAHAQVAVRRALFRMLDRTLRPAR